MGSVTQPGGQAQPCAAAPSHVPSLPMLVGCPGGSSRVGKAAGVNKSAASPTTFKQVLF